VIGKPKSSAGERIVPLFVTNTLKEWKLASPSSELVFTDIKGVEFHQHIVNRGLIPTQVKAGLVVGGKAKMHRASCLPPLLRFMVYQSASRRGPRSTA
jgi:hypothetical protein